MKRWMATCMMAALLLVFAVSSAYAAVPELTLNVASGFYDEPITLLIGCSDSRAAIYYTLDGTTPDENSFVYDRPILLEDSGAREDVLTHMEGTAESPEAEYRTTVDFPTAHVVRAIAVSEHGNVSQEACGTYFVGYDREELYGDVPLMLLVAAPEDLFDEERGIYVRGKIYDEWIAQQTEPFKTWQITANYTQRGREWERPVHVTYLPAEGSGFAMHMGLRVKGNISRMNQQKSLRLIAREEYGEKNLKYVLYPDNIREQDGGIVDKYKSFTLRSGGSDIDYAKIRDPLITNLAVGLRMETAQNMPCIAFINGEYWGVYSLTEEFSRHFFQYHYGIDDDHVITVKNARLEDGEEEDFDLFKALYDFITENDMRDPQAYARACEMIDIDSLADYCALQFYVINEDGPFNNNNWQLWRIREEDKRLHALADGKWRMVLFDTDYSSGVFCDGGNAAEDNITPVFESGYSQWRNFPDMVSALLVNEDFRQRVVMACCDVRNLYFHKDRTSAFVETMREAYLPYVPDSQRRFGPERILSNPEERVGRKMNNLKQFFEERYGCFTGIVGQAFGLGEACRVTIEVSDPQKGRVCVNGRDLPVTSGEAMEYFPQYGLTATVVPAWGAKFVGWEIAEGNAVLSSDRETTTQIDFAESFTLRAVFR